MNQGPADLQSAALTTELCTHLRMKRILTYFAKYDGPPLGGKSRIFAVHALVALALSMLLFFASSELACCLFRPDKETKDVSCNAESPLTLHRWGISFQINCRGNERLFLFSATVKADKIACQPYKQDSKDGLALTRKSDRIKETVARRWCKLISFRKITGLWRNGSASDSRSEGWEFESLWPHFCLQAEMQGLP